MKNSLVTLIVPVSDGESEQDLTRCLRAALDQDYDNLQIWAVDNFSAGRTYDVLVDIEKRYRNRLFVARLFAKFNSFGLRQRIQMMINPRSLYLQPLLPQQILAPGWVSESVALLESDVAIKSVICHANAMAPDGTVRLLPEACPSDRIIPGPERMLDLFLHGGQTALPCLYRTEIYYKGYDEGYVFDRYLDLFHQFIAASLGEVGYFHEARCHRLDQSGEAAPDPQLAMKALVERYILIQGFSTIARRIRRDEIASRLPEALNGLCEQCLDLSQAFERTGDMVSARRYAFLGMAFGDDANRSRMEDLTGSFLLGGD